MLKKNLEQREILELIAIIQHMLRQEPELQWLLMTSLPTASSRKSSLDPAVYRQQVLDSMVAGENQCKRKRGEVQRRLTAIKTIADEFVVEEQRVIEGWARDALTHKSTWSSGEKYKALLATLERTNKR